MDNYENSERETDLIKEVIHSSRNIRRLRDRSNDFKMMSAGKEYSLLSPMLPSIGRFRRAPILHLK